MILAKEQLQAVIDRMSDQVDMEEIMYELYVIDQVMKGRKQVEEGKVLTQEEVEKRLLS